MIKHPDHTYKTALALALTLSCWPPACADENAGSTQTTGALGTNATGAAGAGSLPSATRASAASSGSTMPAKISDADYCDGSGPPAEARPGANATQSCSPSIASRVFEHGLCTCSDATFTGAFTIDAIDSSSRGRPGQGRSGASVGVNDQLYATGLVDIHGSLVVAGSGPLAITTGGYTIDGNFETNSDLYLTGANIRFGRDLWVNGEISAVGISSVVGDVYQSTGHSMFGMTVGGRVFQRDFEVPKPCACGARELIDIDAIVEQGIAAAGSKPGTLLNLGTGGTLDLGCGRFAFRDAHIIGVTELRAHGRTAIFIDGDLTVTGVLTTDLGLEGELDIFITGDLLLTGTGQIGMKERPSALRIYVGGAGDIAITGANQFAANLYAPRAKVIITGLDQLYGSFFVGEYHAIGSQAMHYDPAIVRSGSSGCDTPPPPDRCSQDLDCRSPQVCMNGDCTRLDLGPE